MLFQRLMNIDDWVIDFNVRTRMEMGRFLFDSFAKQETIIYSTDILLVNWYLTIVYYEWICKNVCVYINGKLLNTFRLENKHINNI